MDSQRKRRFFYQFPLAILTFIQIGKQKRIKNSSLSADYTRLEYLYKIGICSLTCDSSPTAQPGTCG